MSELSIDVKSPLGPATAAGAPVDSTPSQSSTDVVGGSDTANSKTLMTRLANGDQQAMNELIELHGNFLARLVGRLLAWSPDHEDVFQDLMVHIWIKADKYDASGPLKAWLRRVAINRCQNHLRRQTSVRKQLLSFVDSVRSSRSSQFGDATGESNSRLRSALAKLKPTERTAIVLYYLEEMSSHAIARQLGISTQTFHVRLCRARKKLRTVYSQSEGQQND